MRLGYVNVDSMLSQITWTQFLEWSAYAELDPFGEEREDIRNAQIATVIANVNRGRSTPAYKIADFILHFGDYETPKKTWQQLKAVGRMMFTLFGGKDDDK